MKTVLLAAAAMAFAATMPQVSAFACDTGSGPGLSRTAGGVVSGTPSGMPHYQWQYHYDHHAQWVGSWVLVN